MTDRGKKENAIRLLKLLLVMPVFAAGPAVAGPFEDAGAAYNKGDYATALRLIRPLAEQGNAAAQINLGVMHADGRGVPQDYLQAHMWSNLAAANGEAANNRDIVATKMAPARIAEAQKRRSWRGSGNLSRTDSRCRCRVI